MKDNAQILNLLSKYIESTDNKNIQVPSNPTTIDHNWAQISPMVPDI